MFCLREDEVNPSLEQVIFPCALARKEVNIKIDIADSDVSLLIRKSTIKLAGIKLDLENDTATICGKQASLDGTTSISLEICKFT